MATGKWRAQEEEDKLKLLLTDSSAGDDYVHHFHGKRYGTTSSSGEPEELESLAGSTYLPLRYKEEQPTIRNQTLQMTINYVLNPGSCDYGGWSYVLLAIAAVVMFPPLGTAALVLAILARQNAVRDRKSAERHSRMSLIISGVSIISGLIVLALVLGFTQSSRNDTSKLATGARRPLPRTRNSRCPRAARYLHDEFCYAYMLPVASSSHCLHGHYGNRHCYYESRDKYNNAGRCDMAPDGYCYTSSRQVCSSTNEPDCFWYVFPTDESTRCLHGHECGSFCGYSFRHVNNLWYRMLIWGDCDCLNDLYCYCY